MNTKAFFGKAKEICKYNLGCCLECPLYDHCSDGIFAQSEKEIDKLIQIVNEEYEMLINKAGSVI